MEVVALPTVRAGDEMKAFYRGGLSATIRAANPDIVLMMEESFTLFGLQIFRSVRRFDPNVPIVFYNNNVAGYELAGFRLALLYRAIGRYVTPKCALGISVNETADAVLERTGHPIERRVLFYGIDDEIFTAEGKGAARRSVRERFDLPSNATVILYLGRLLRLKGIDELIEAGARLQGAERKVHLLVVGSGPDRERLGGLVKRLEAEGYVHFVETIPFEQVPELMRGVDAHVLPSRPEINEQFGRVNVEAMLSGTTAIAARSGGVPEVIADGGFLYDAGDTESLVAILRTVVDQTEQVQATTERGQVRARQTYSVARFVRDLQSLLFEQAIRSRQR